jgi:hypothetical protein
MDARQALVVFLLLTALLGSSGRAQQAAVVHSVKTDQAQLPPQDKRWDRAQPLTVPLAPQVVVKPRRYEASIKELEVRSLYDDERLTLRIEWADATRDEGIGAVLGPGAYQDAVAIQFPADPRRTRPYFGMGEPGNPVVIYHWKSGWAGGGTEQPHYDVDERFPNIAVDEYPFSGKKPGEIAEAKDYQNDKAYISGWYAGNPLSDPELQAKTSVEKLTAEGFGTLTSADVHDGVGQAVYENGRWKVVISIPREQDTFSFEEGLVVPMAFAAWDGSNNERDGEKALTTWYFLALEKPVGASVYVWPILAFVAVGAIEIGLLRWARRRRQDFNRTGGASA